MAKFGAVCATSRHESVFRVGPRSVSLRGISYKELSPGVLADVADEGGVQLELGQGSRHSLLEPALGRRGQTALDDLWNPPGQCQRDHRGGQRDPDSRRAPFGTICGVNSPLRSCGTSTSTAPMSLSTLLPLLPFTGIPVAPPGRITLSGHQLLGDLWHQLRLEIGLPDLHDLADTPGQAAGEARPPPVKPGGGRAWSGSGA